MLNKIRTLFVWSLCLTCAPALSAADFYVATNGSDLDSGTQSAPFQTLAKAQSAVRALLPSATEPINVWVRGGTYRLIIPLVFEPSDSGTTAAPVKYSAYQTESVTLSGAVQLRPTWTTHSGGILVATIGSSYDFDVLAANGIQQVMARYPNYDGNAPILDGSSADATAPARVATWTNPSTGFVRGLHNLDWGGNSFRITGKDANNNATLQWVGDNNRGSGLNTNHRMVENIFEELDAPGEWFYDKPAGKLYFYPPAGLNANTAIFEGSTTEELIKVVGNASSKVKELTFDNFTYTGTHRTLFTRAYEPLLRGDWCVARAGAVYLQDAENITVSNSKFIRVGGNAVFISGYNRNHVITNNEFIDTGATCVNVVGLPNAVRYPSFWPHALYPSLPGHRTDIQDVTPGPLTDDYPKNCTISYNYMYNMGRFEKQVCGVNLSMAESITVSHNTIHRSPRSGVNVNDGTWGGHIFEFNDIFDCVRESGDHGPFNSWGRDRYWSYQGFDTNGGKGTAKKPYALLDAWKPIIIRNNRFHYSTSKTWGIDLDDGSSNYEVYNNLCLNTGFKLREGFNRKVYNNIIVNQRGNLHVWFDGCEDNIQRNIIVSGSPWAFAGLSATNMAAKQATIDYNLFWNGSNGNTVNPGFSGWKDLGLDVHSVTGNPLFTNPAALDYSVQPTSPALALGFVNFPMNQFGRPGSPAPAPITSTGGSVEVVDSEPLMGASVTSIYSETVKSAVGISDNNGVFFESVPSGSYAGYQGFATNDVIRAINGTSVTTKLSFWAVYNSIMPGSTISLTIRRNQTDQAFSFVKTTEAEKLNDSAGAVYTGTGWQVQKNALFFNGDIRVTRTNGDSFTQTFNGTGVDVIAETYSDETQAADVYIDGVLDRTISTYYSTSRLYQQVVYAKRGLSPGQHTVRVVNRTSNFMFLDAVTVFSGGDGSTAPVATAMGGASQVALSWTNVSGATSYHISRSLSGNSGFTVIASGLTTTSFTDTGLTGGTTYYYKVTALGAGGTSIDSTVVSAVPVTLFVSRATGGISSASSENPAIEGVDKAFDGNTTSKWWTRHDLAPGWIQYDFGIGKVWTVSRYDVTSANDMSARDPKDWQLLGSNDGTTWTILDTRLGENFATRFLTKSYTVSSPAAFRFFRFNITANNGATSSQLAELALLSVSGDPGDITPPQLALPANINRVATGPAGAPVDYTVSASDAVSGAITPVCTPASGSVFPLGTTTVQCSATDAAGNTATGTFTVTIGSGAALASASSISGVAENSAKGLDQSISTKWYSGPSGGTAWLQYKFEYDRSKVVASYAITSANDVPQRDPKDWQLLGSNDGSTWTTVDSRTGQTFSARFQTRLYTTGNTTAYRYYRINVSANSGGSAYGVQLSEWSLVYPLASPWTSSDIGAVAAIGTAGSDGDTFTMIGSGAGIMGSADEFHSVHQTATGDCDATARVASLQNTNALAKSGVMIRESLNPNSSFVSLVVTSGNGLAFQYRNGTGGTVVSTSTPAITAPHWVRIVRSGDVFNAFRSANGNDWTAVGTVTLTMTSNVYLGLPISSHNDGTLGIGIVNNVIANP